MTKVETRGDKWTAEEETALVAGVGEHGLDFDHIKVEAGARLGDCSAGALRTQFERTHPDKFRELRELNPSGGRGLSWTSEEDEALKRGMTKHGRYWEKIRETENEVLGHRKVGALEAGSTA